MATKNDTTALTVTGSDTAEEALFPVLHIAPSQLQEELEETLAGEELGPASIDKIKLPSGGGQMWTLPGLDEDETDARTFKGVVLFGHYSRLYWATAYGQGEAGPPNCYSPDARTGVGDYGYGSEQNPTGECATCPLAKWEARDPKNPSKRSQACGLNYLMYLLLPGMRFPVQLKLPRTSLNQKDDKGWRAFKKKLANRGIPTWGVVTEIGLRQATTPTGTKYSVATFKLAERLTEEEAARARAYAESLKPHFVPGPAEDDEPVEASPVESRTAPATATNPAF